MTTLKFKDIKKMNKEDIKKKLKELRLELIKSKANSSKKGQRAREIKKIIARIYTFNNLENKSGELDKK
ncbi:MAG: 50S ribosomal protein L29 [archaeon]